MGQETKYTCKRCCSLAQGADELCDGCWELETRIKNDPGLARKILAEIGELDAKQVTTDKEFHSVLVLLMCSDPWPVADERSQKAVAEWADKEAKARGYGSWVEAYHLIK